jgi:hypothetical protein
MKYDPNAQDYKTLIPGIIDVCSRMISGKIDLIAGSRDLQKYYVRAPRGEKELFYPIIGFESETDTYPMGEDRKKYDQKTLDTLDKEYSEYTIKAKSSVLSACSKIIEYYK